ncbi:MAG: cyclopropane-fatty-acyl-phospholipid synthase family protein [Gammaproteobacteria bacterium]|nr:cyclopropane-fatty-acyl-phospholipid synthase family protein [Gammaproteobacteria bacterium]MDH5304509.1 cyclopropane-fatty-acyl-phospholipid synthase family protein [Gammaproteobacteria bacterium]
MSVVTSMAVSWTETGLVPDPVIRSGIRRLLESKRREIHAGDVEYAADELNRFVAMMDASPIAVLPELANEQHYEVPAGFFAAVMGEHLKYSCGYWPGGVTTLTEAEAAALSVTVRRADIRDGQRILDLGCGWGSLSLWIAERFPNCTVTAVSNSTSQREFIVARARERKLDNIRVLVQDMNEFTSDDRFDRIVSVEMFEHMRNYRELFAAINRWLVPDGRFFMHIFCHYSTPYEYIDKGPGDWMSRYFFSGGIMPCAELPLRFADQLSIEQRWQWNGKHYAKTCDAWLARMDSNKAQIMPQLSACYGASDAGLWWQRWRIFFMACSELFRYRHGEEWYVCHYLFRKAVR